jgi:hypothetical protein
MPEDCLASLNRVSQIPENSIISHHPNCLVMLLLKVVTDVLYCCVIMGSMFLLFGLLFLVHMEIS